MRLTEHARKQLEHRRLDEETVLSVAVDPEQTVALKGSREVRQSRIHVKGERSRYLLRVVVETLSGEPVVITAYRTSKIAKYWRLP